MDANPTHSNYYRSLTINMVLIIILVSVTPMLIISGTVRYHFQTAYQEKVRSHLAALTEKQAQNIDTFLSEKMADLRALAKSFTMEQLNDDAFLAERFRVLREEYGGLFEDIGIVNQTGVQTAYAGPLNLKGADYSAAPWFLEAVKADSYMTDIFLGLRGTPHFAAAVRREHKEQKWILRATVDFNQFDLLVAGMRMEHTGFAFILNRKGEFQTTPATGTHPFVKPCLDFLRAGAQTTEPVRVAQSSDATGKEVVQVMCRLKQGEWLLVFQQDAEEAYAALYAARRFTLLVFMVGVAAIVIVAILLSKRMVKRIHDADIQKEMMNERVIQAGKLASLGELAAGIAHEINNPVAVMVEEAGWMKDLLEDEDPEHLKSMDEFERSLREIKTQGSRCKEITGKLLSFAHMGEPRPRPVQINDVITETIDLCRKRADLAEVKISAHLESGLPTVPASPTEIHQVLINLVNNSLDAIQDAGGTIEIRSGLADGYVVIDVSDSGPGIPAADLARIFDPFFTTKPVGKGTGLGLSICYGIMTKMGGKITVHSTVGRGTTFHIQVPVSRLNPEAF